MMVWVFHANELSAPHGTLFLLEKITICKESQFFLPKILVHE